MYFLFQIQFQIHQKCTKMVKVKRSSSLNLFLVNFNLQSLECCFSFIIIIIDFTSLNLSKGYR